MPEKLTEKFVRAATCPPGKKDALFFDKELQGFALRVSTSGSKTFLAQFTVARGKRRVAIGRWGVITVEQARNGDPAKGIRGAKEILGQAAGGRDVFAADKAAIAADRAAKDAARLKASADAFTFERMIEGWVAAREGDRRASYLDEAERCMRRNLADWLPRPAASITADDAIATLDRLKRNHGVYAANRSKAYASAAFTWAKPRFKLPANPMRGLERPGEEVERERVLTADEIGAIWRATGKLGVVASAYVRVLMLTLQRRMEVAQMAWAELDDPLDPAVWHLPGSRAKNRRSADVHLSEPVRRALKTLPRIKDNPFVFATRATGAIAAFSGIKAQLDAALAERGNSIHDWRYHDFRRTGVTTLASKGVAPHVADKLLNHITGTIQGVAAVYQRHRFLEERKAALDLWAGYVLGAAEEKVVQFARVG